MLSVGEIEEATRDYLGSPAMLGDATVLARLGR